MVTLLAAFVVDLQTPLGVADWWAYLLAIIMGLLWRGKHAALAVAAVAIVLTFLGGLLSPPGDPFQGWTNRSLGVLTCAILGGMCWALGSRVRPLEQVESELGWQPDDRGRTARDLHDGVLQGIYGVWLKLRVAKADLEVRHPDGANALDRASSELSRAIKELRAVIFGIDPRR